MKITILTLFPEMFSALSASIIGRAQKEGKLCVEVVNLRDYTDDDDREDDRMSESELGVNVLDTDDVMYDDEEGVVSDEDEDDEDSVFDDDDLLADEEE